MAMVHSLCLVNLTDLKIWSEMSWKRTLIGQIEICTITTAWRQRNNKPFLQIIIVVGQTERKNLLYRGTIPFCFHIVPWRLVSTFRYVGCAKISCGLLPTRFSSNFVLNSITVKKCEISNTFLTQMTYIVWKLAKNYI
jgi:hypothetical protein